MSFDKIFDLTAGVYFEFYIICICPSRIPARGAASQCCCPAVAAAAVLPLAAAVRHRVRDDAICCCSLLHLTDKVS